MIVPKVCIYKFHQAGEPFIRTTYHEDLYKRCWECGAINVSLHDHHPVPRSRGGTKTIPLCEPCHSKAHHRKKNMNTSQLVHDTYERKKRKASITGIPMKWGDQNMAKRGTQALGVIVRQENARKYNAMIGSMLQKLDPDNQLGLAGKAEMLNEHGSTTRRGRPFNTSNLHRILKFNKREQT